MMNHLEESANSPFELVADLLRGLLILGQDEAMSKKVGITIATLKRAAKEIDKENAQNGAPTRRGEELSAIHNSVLKGRKMERTIIFDGENGKGNYCGCENCKGGRPVNLPEVGQRLFSTGQVIDHVAHQSPCTLFLTADRERAMYVNGRHEPYIPGIAGSPKRLFQKAGFTHLAMIDSMSKEYCEDIDEVAGHLSYFGCRADVKTRLESFGFPAEYIGQLTDLIPQVFKKPSEEDLDDQVQQYHCWGDVFMLGSQEVGEEPSFLRGWSYTSDFVEVKTEWDNVFTAIEAGKLPEPEFVELDKEGPFEEIRWQGKIWRKDYQSCPGKYNWVSTGGKWKPVSGWYEVK